MLKESLTFGYFDLEGLMLGDLFIRLMLKESFLSYLMLNESFNLFYREDSNGNSK